MTTYTPLDWAISDRNQASNAIALFVSSAADLGKTSVDLTSEGMQERLERWRRAAEREHQLRQDPSP